MTTKAPALPWRAGFDWRPLWLPLTLMGAVFVVLSFVPPGHGFDLLAYWQVDPADPYARVGDDLVGQGVFRYAPPFALLFAPLGVLPWPVMVAVWLALQLGALYYIAGRWALALVVFPPVWFDIVYGNVNIFIAAAIVSGAWWFAALTKVTPGVGILWERSPKPYLVIAAIVGVSLVIQGPLVWGEWFDVLHSSTTAVTPHDAIPIPLLPRVIVAAGLVLYGRWTDRWWLVPVAVTLAMPTLWANAFVPLIALASRRPWLGR